MIRATRSIVSGVVKQTLRIAPLSPPPPLPVFRAASMWFSTLQEPKIFQMMKGKVDSKGADIIFIEMATLNEKQKKEAIRLFLDRIFEGNIDSSYIAHQKFNVHLKKDPDMLFEAYFFRIGEYIGRLIEYIQKKEIRAKKMAARQINEAFVVCFDAVKRMTSEETPYKEIQLYKTFAHYHAVFLKMLVEPPKMKMCLTKARDLYKGSLTKIMMQVKVLVQNEKKLNASLKLQETINVTKSEKQEAIQLIREGNYRLFEHFSEAIIEIVNIQLQLDDLQQKSKLQKDAIEDPKEEKKAPPSREQKLKGVDLQKDDSISLQQKLQFPKTIASMEVIIDNAVKNYTLVKEFIHKSQFYSKLKKMNIQISYQNNLRKAYKQKSQQNIDRLKGQAAEEFLEKMDELFKEGAVNFKKLCSDFEDPQMLEDQCIQMAEIKMNCFELTEGDPQALMSQLGEDLQGAISIIPDQKFRKNIVNSVVKHVKELYEVDISRFLEKVPRNLRMARRPRSLEKK